MTPTIVTKGELFVVGTRETHEWQDGKLPTISSQWEQLGAHLTPLELPPGATVGVSLCDPIATGSLDYVAGALVDKLPASLPEGLAALRLEPQTYAVFTHGGPIPTLQNTYNAVHAWLNNNSKYTCAPAPQFEYYDARYTGFDAVDSELDLYIPVKELA